MSRPSALFFGTLWLGLLMVLNLAVLSRPETLRHYVDRALSDTFASKVTYGSFEGGGFGGIALKGVRIMDPDDPSEVFVSLDEVRINIDWSGVVVGASPVEEVVLINPSLQLAWDGSAKLRIPSPLAEADDVENSALPRFRVEGLRLHLLNSPYLVREDVTIDLPKFVVDLIPENRVGWLYQFAAELDDPDFGELKAYGHFGEAAIDVELVRKGFELTSRMRDILQPEVADLFGRFGIEGGFEIVADLESTPAPATARGESIEGAPEPGSADFAARVNLDNARISIAGWPQSLTELSGVLRYSNGVLETRRLTGKLEGSRFWCEGGVKFGAGDPKVDLKGGLSGLDLDDQFVEHLGSLPAPGPDVQEQMRQWEVRGPAEVTFTIATELRAGFNQIIPRVSLDLMGCDFAYRGSINDQSGKREGFPYPLKDLRGTIRLDDNGMVFDSLRAFNGSMTLGARGRVDYSRKNDETWSAHVSATGLAIDETLLACFDAETAATLRTMNAEGRVGVEVLSERLRGDPSSMPPSVVVRFDGVRLRPDEFPYQFENLRGSLEIRGDDLLRIDSVSIEHEAARITASGRVGISDREGELRVDLQGSDLALDAALLQGFDQFVPEISTVLRDLRPKGKISNLALALTGTRENPEPAIEATLYLKDLDLFPIDPEVRISDISAVVDVWHGPLRREITIQEGAVAHIAGERLNVEGGFRPGRDWRLRLKAQDISFDDELLTAIEGAVPSLKDPSVRPEVNGRASLDVAVRDLGRGVALKGRLGFSDMSIRPPNWQDTRLEKLSCKVLLDTGGFQLLGLKAVIPRPKELPPLPSVNIRSATEPFESDPQVRVSIGGCTFTLGKESASMGLGDVSLQGLPLETWVLDILGVGRKERAELGVPALFGRMNMRFSSAKVDFGPGRTLLNGGELTVLGVHVGTSGELFLEEGHLKDLDLVVTERGQVRIGDRRTEFIGKNFRVFGVPVPQFEARIRGDQDGITLTEIAGVLFGFEYDGFDWATASLTQLRRYSVQRGWMNEKVARTKSVEQLREMAQRKLGVDVRHASEADLRTYVVERGWVTRRRAETMGVREIKRLLEERENARSMGLLWGEATSLALDWSGGFNLDAHLREVQIASAVRALGGNPKQVRGRLAARIHLFGNISDSTSWKGDGHVTADAVNVVELPLFLNILKAVDISSWMRTTARTKISCQFSIDDERVTLQQGSIGAPSVELVLVPPGTITFGGIIKARLDAQHNGGGIPIFSDIVGFIPSLILDGVVVEGPLENPLVEPRSLGIGSETPGVSGGRKPKMRPPKK